MAAEPLTFLVEGTLLDLTREIGDFIPPDQDQNDESKRIKWDYSALHILVGREVRIVRLPKGVHVAPGLTVNERVSVRVSLPPKIKLITDLPSIGLAEADAA